MEAHATYHTFVKDGDGLATSRQKKHRRSVCRRSVGHVLITDHDKPYWNTSLPNSNRAIQSTGYYVPMGEPLDDGVLEYGGIGVTETVALLALEEEEAVMGTADIDEAVIDGIMPHCLAHTLAMHACYDCLQATRRHLRKLTGSVKAEAENDGGMLAMDHVTMADGCGPKSVGVWVGGRGCVCAACVSWHYVLVMWGLQQLPMLIQLYATQPMSLGMSRLDWCIQTVVEGSCEGSHTWVSTMMPRSPKCMTPTPESIHSISKCLTEPGCCRYTLDCHRLSGRALRRAIV